MKAVKLASLFVLVASILFMPVSAYADTKPYSKVYGADVFAGGWFNTGSGTNCYSDPTKYQAPTFNPVNNQFQGGILAFANGRHGASSDFGAFAMGLVEGNPASSYGFYTGQGSTTNLLSFSNTNNVTANYWGGYFAGATQQIHCIPDYFGTKQNTSPAPTTTGVSFNIGALTSGQYLAPSGVTTDITAGGAATIAAGKAVTVFADGNVYISNNIVYAGTYTSDNVPKLTLVVRGNIFIAPSVTQLDGLYIAQPSVSAISTTGSIWTCHDNTTTIPDGYYIYSNCGTRLTINGAIIAKQLNLMRINGNLDLAPDNEISTSPNIAEVINYVPAMVIGGPFFNQTSTQNPKINSLISLPPVF